MITIDSTQKITMFNGDSGHFTVSISRNGVPVVLTTGDTLTFSVKKNVADVTYALQKVVDDFEDGIATISLDPADTIDLDPNVIENVTNPDFPYYFYDLEWIDSDSNVNTMMKNYKLGKFVLVAGVTHE